LTFFVGASRGGRFCAAAGTGLAATKEHRADLEIRAAPAHKKRSAALLALMIFRVSRESEAKAL
jgi:hypothetical protein